MSRKRETLADVIRAAVLADGRSENQLATDAGITTPALNRFMRGVRGLNLTSTDKLLVALGLTVRLVRVRRGKGA